jgi:hypothetical protein
VPINPGDSAFDDLLALVAQRESELHAVKDELQEWLKRNRASETHGAVGRQPH